MRCYLLRHFDLFYLIIYIMFFTTFTECFVRALFKALNKKNNIKNAKNNYIILFNKFIKNNFYTYLNFYKWIQKVFQICTCYKNVTFLDYNLENERNFSFLCQYLCLFYLFLLLVIIYIKDRRIIFKIYQKRLNSTFQILMCMDF